MGRKPKSTAVAKPAQSVGERSAELATQPSVSAAAVIQTFAGKMLGDEPDINCLVENLLDTFATVDGGDLSAMESMLIGQAKALETIFVSLVRRAQAQTQQRHLESFLALGLKAQNQSRATIATLADLKYPRQVAFVRQTNVAHGAQQINNQLEPGAGSRTEKNQSEKSKMNVLEHSDGSKTMDAGTAATASTNYPAHHAVAFCDRADKRGRQG